MFFSKRKFKVNLKGFSEIEYCEENKKLIIGSETLSGDAGIVIYASEVTHWAPPNEKEIISSSDLVRIRDNILSELARHKIKAEWVD